MRLSRTDLASLAVIFAGGAAGVAMFGPQGFGGEHRHVHVHQSEHVVELAGDRTADGRPEIRIVTERDGEPLVYVDGVRVEGGLPDLDPDGIDRVEVIKGEAAVRLHGRDGAYGVIQIFTKAAEGEKSR